MKRPFLVAAVLSIAAVYLSVYAYAYIVIMVGILIAAVFLIYLKHTGIPMFYVLFIMMFPVMCFRTRDYAEKLRYQGKFSDRSYIAYVKGYVSGIKHGDNSFTIQIRNATITPDSWGSELECGINIYSKEDFCNAGDYVNLKVIMKDYNTPSNEGQFDSLKYYTSQGFIYCADMDEIIEVKDSSSYLSYVYRLSDSVKNVYKKAYTSQNAGIMQSIVLGDRSELDDDVKRLYQKNGISHILAISALHVSLVGICMYDFLKRKTGNIASACISTIFILSYLCMTGYSASASRAVIMILVYMLADVLGRTSDGANTLGIASVILLWINPYNIVNSAFWLSFLAMSGIIFIKPLLSNDKNILIYINRPDKKHITFMQMIVFGLADSIITGLCITITTLPVVLIISGQVPVISILLNIIVIPLMSVIMVSGIFTGIAGMFSIRAAYFFAGAGGFVLDFSNVLCEISSHFKYAVIVTGTPGRLKTVLYFTVLIGWVLVHMLTKNKRADTICLSMLVLAMMGLHYDMSADMKAAMLDVGQGDSIAVHTKDGMNVLFDGGSTTKKNVGRYTIYSYLKHCGVRKLDYVFVSHPDKDHINGIYELVEMCDNTFEIGTVVLPEVRKNTSDGADDMSDIEQTVKNAGIKIVYASSGDCIKSGKFVVECVHPCSGYSYESANDYSAVYLVKYGDFSMLMTGDAEKKAEKCMIEDAVKDNRKLSDVNVLKTGHHGSKGSSSEEFLKYVKPETALISCGAGNSYGHPHSETLQRLSEADATVYRTDEAGEIIVRVRGDSYKIKEYVR